MLVETSLDTLVCLAGRERGRGGTRVVNVGETHWTVIVCTVLERLDFDQQFNLT
jgi:hypothetical protein